MRTLWFKCPQCGQTYEGSAEDAGAEFQCEACGKTFLLDASAAAPRTRTPVGIVWYVGAFPKLFSFRSRARRREFWWTMFFQTIVMFCAGVVDALLETDQWIVAIIAIATALPMLAVTVRRLHDTNKSGWWTLLQAVPVLNLAYLVWLMTNGDAGTNRFGPDPKQPQ